MMYAMHSSLRRAAPWLLLGGITLLFFARALLAGEVFFYRDLAWFHYPLRNLWVTQVQHGLLPFLNPLLNGGQPLLANPNYSIFYPGNLLYFLLPFDTAWNVLLAGHVFWAMIGFYYLARDLDCEPPAALAGALVMGFGGPLLSCMTYYNILITGAWLPWVLFLFRGALRATPRRGARATLALATMLLAGEPTVLLIAAALLVFLWIQSLRQNGSPKSQLLQGVLLVTPAILIACIQLAPSLLWLPNTSRGAGMDFRMGAAYWSLHPARWIEFFAPNYYGNVMSSLSRDYWGSELSDGGYPYVLKLYCGWLPWILVPLVWKRPGGKPAVALLAAGLLLSLGHRLPGYELLYRIFPPLHVVRYPEKFLIAAQLALALIVSLGCSEVRHGRPVRICLYTGVAFLVVLGSAFPFAAGFPAHSSEVFHALLQGCIYGALACAVVWLAGKKAEHAVSAALLPLLLVFDLLPVTLPIPATLPADQVHQTPVVLQRDSILSHAPVLHRGDDEPDAYFAGGMEPDRLMREALHPFFGLIHGISYGATVDVDRMMWTASVRRAALLRRGFLSAEFPGRMRESGIGSLISLSPVQNSQLILDQGIQFSEGNHLYVYRLSPPPAPAVELKQGSGKIEWQEPSPYEIRIQSQLQQAGALVVRRNALPGWNCRIDGKPASTEMTADGFLSVPLPEGAREVRLAFTPPGLKAGAAFCVIGVVMLLVSAIFPRYKSRKLM